jgi:hypothetical protein
MRRHLTETETEFIIFYCENPVLFPEEEIPRNAAIWKMFK